MATHQVLIVGGGLSGLSLAAQLEAKGIDYLLLEARDRFGGRIYAKDGFDLGPAWFWPGQQRVKHLLFDLGLNFYPQQESGKSLFQMPTEVQTINQPMAGMCYRVEGGLGALIGQLLARVPEHKRVLNASVNRINQSDGEVKVHARVKQEHMVYTAEQIVLAVPPRLITQNIDVEPALPEGFQRELTQTPTWMAGHAKAVVRYANPFWREAGFSGSAFSQKGPLMQIHDASQDSEEKYALFGFFGLPTEHRKAYGQDKLKSLIGQQMIELFGPTARDLVGIDLYDWGLEPLTTADKDKSPLTHHPRYGLSQTRWWDGQLLIGVTESAQQYGGFLEGALEAAEMSLTEIVAFQDEATKVN